MKRATISSRENCDFISRLPNPILHRILGLLRIKEAVQTCVLSKRWEHLWTSLPSLNFRYLNFVDECGDKLMSIQRFVKFVNALLVRRKPLDLEVFHLFCYELGSNSAVRDWIRYAVNHNTRVLHLSSCGIMPWSIYTCTSLDELFLEKLHIDLSIQIVNLPKLKKLRILYADLNSNCVKNFLSGCPKLEFFRLGFCNFTDCIIAHGCLKYLYLASCHIKEELFVTAPNLHTFFYGGQLPLPCKTTLNMPSLSSACLMRCHPSMIKCLEGMAICLRFLTNIEFLKLHMEFHRHKELSTSVLSLELPIFPNLKNVTVIFCVFSCFQMVTSILKSSPNLEKLTLLQKNISHVEEEASTNESTNISSTIAFPPHKKLTIVEVKYWKYNHMIRQLVDTLMDATMEFENLKIHLSKYKSSRQY